MSDHLHGSESYYLESIDANLSRLADNFTNMELEHHSQAMTKLAQTTDNTERLIAAFRDLLNVENECANYVRELRKQRDEAARKVMRDDFKLMFEIALGMHKCPDEVEMYVSGLYDGALYDITGALLKITEIVTEVAAVRERNKRETEALIKQDARHS